MLRWLQLLMALAAAFGFGRWVDAGHLFVVLQPLTVALSIFTAAVLVRLARGMPTLDWKSIPLGRRKQLTSDLVSVAQEYAGLLLVLFVLLVTVLSLIGVGSKAVALWQYKGFHLSSAIIGLLSVFVSIRMCYVVWRDLDIIQLQKKIIDDMTDREDRESRAAAAEEKLQAMKSVSAPGGTKVRVEDWQN